MPRSLLLLGLSLLCGCAQSSLVDRVQIAQGNRPNGPSPTAFDAAPAPEIPSSGYKASIEAYLRRYAVDPKALHQVKIGTPFSGVVHGQKGAVVCMELTTEKSKSAASGDAKHTAFLLQINQVLDSDYDASICQQQHLESRPDVGATGPT